MKILKLIGLTLLTMVVVVGALWLSYGGGGTSVAVIESNKAKELQEEVTDFYAQATAWSQASYDSLSVQEIGQYSKQEQISTDEETLLINHLNNAATNNVVQLLKDEFRKPDCRASRVANLSAGVQFLQSKMGKNDSRLSEMDKCCRVYSDVRRFVGGTFTYEPHFSGRSWTPFSTLHQATVSRRDAFRADAYYVKYLSGITALSSGLSAVPEKSMKGRTRYYEQLERRIEAYYEDIATLSADDVRVFRDEIYRRFSEEAGSNSAASSRLWHCYNRLKKRLNQPSDSEGLAKRSSY